MNASWIEPALLRAFADEQTDAHRVYTASDGWVERFGADILISHKTPPAAERIVTELYLWSVAVQLRMGRIFTRLLPKKNEERDAPVLLIGDAQSNLQSVATERYLRYGIDFAAGYSVGLFLDQRENRSFVRRIVPKKVLNCFAYTCSFSVAAASVGAQTVSVDLSKKSLARGRENFGLNSLSTADHRFIADDVLTVVPKLARKGEKFDVIILDPPTFSRTKRGKGFQVERDFEGLLHAATEVAERDSHILLSTNCATLNSRTLEVMAKFCLKASRRAGLLHRENPLPDFPDNSGASTVWLTLR